MHLDPAIGGAAVELGFGADGLSALATHAGFSRVTIDATPTIDGHPCILATLERPVPDQGSQHERSCENAPRP